MFALAGVLVTAGGTYLWLNYTLGTTQNSKRSDQISEYIERDDPTRKDYEGSTVDPADIEDPAGMDILLMGSDSRAELGDEEYGRADTMMLLHVDPDHKFASILSLPRDLRVTVPGYGEEKINAAYALGGPLLAIQTVEDLTGVKVDHYVNIDFEAFREVTKQLNGVFVDVDRRYYNDKESWEWINLKPGYQRLYGENALDWVRFRHDSNGDFGRIERQQRFLKAVKDQAFRWDSALKLPKMVQVVAANLETEIDTGDLLRLAYYGIRLGPDRIRQVTLESGMDDIGGISYVTATDAAIRDAVDELLTPPAAPANPQVAEGETGAGGDSPDSGADSTTTDRDNASNPNAGAPDLRGITVDVLNGNGRGGEATRGARYLRNMGASVNRVDDAESFGYSETVVAYPAGQSGAAALVAEAVNAGEVVAEGVSTITVILGADFKPSGDVQRETVSMPSMPNAGDWQALRNQASFDLMAPTTIPQGYSWKDYRLYDIDSDDGNRAALKVYYKLKGEDQYLGLMETVFVDAPAASPGDKVKSGDLELTVVDYEGKVDRIWWKSNGVLYWISNTLSYRLDRDEMLAIAESMVPVQ